MLPTSSVAQYLDHASRENRDIVLELRNLITSIAPDAAEIRHSKGFSYFHAQRGGTVSAGICQIIIFDDHVRLAFIHGAFLPDPLGLLVGDAKYKKYIRITNYDEAPWDYLKSMITESSNFDPRSITLSESEQ
jgi:hypothetical protein